MEKRYDGSFRMIDRWKIFPDRAERLEELGRDLVNAGYLRGDYLLSSGVATSYYFDKYLFETKPGILRRLATFLAELVPANTDRLAGPELGAVPILTALALETGLPFVIVKKHRSGNGQTLVAGELYQGERVTVIEDVISTGSEALRTAREVGGLGALVLGILAVLDRDEGASEKLVAAGFHVSSLFRRVELGL